MSISTKDCGDPAIGQAAVAVADPHPDPDPDPDKSHEAEIELAGDALTHTEIAATLSKAASREIIAVFLSQEEQAQRLGAPTADSQIWNDRVPYTARLHHAAHCGLTTTTFEQWAAQQNWNVLAI